MSSAGMEGKLPISRNFFKVMMPGFLTKLSLPPAYCRKLNGEKSEEAILTSSEGTWQVKIGKCSKGLISFNEGWDKFVGHHGLNIGDFVVFEHKGDLHFDVTVFDPSACKKEFPARLGNDQRKRTFGDQVFDPSTCKKEFPAKLGNDQRKRTFRDQAFDPSTCKKEFHAKSGNDQRKREPGDQAFDPSTCKKEFAAKLGNDQRKRGLGDQVNFHKHAKHIKRESPLEEAAAYTPGNPHFITTIAACNGISSHPYMNIPAEFLKANELNKYCSLTLIDPSGKLWPVKLSIRNNLSGKWLRTYMAKGWHEFYSSNKLKKGDVCIFELNRSTTGRISDILVMDVRIFAQQT